MFKKLIVLLCILPVYAGPHGAVNLVRLLTDKAHDWSNDTVVSFLGTAQFENSTERWTPADAPTYLASVSPANERDVATVLKLATSHGIPFLATGARHGFTDTLGHLQQGLAIDLSQFDSHDIDSTAETITIGGSNTIGDVMDSIAEAGFMIQSGSGSCPGYVGLTLGAGVGRYMGYFGLVLDGLVSARMVTADGRVVEVSETNNSDLFWGIRGAGANFGIITSATYKLHKMTDHNNGQVLNADFIFPANNTEKYFEYLESWSGRMPANVAAISLINYNDLAGEAQVLANWVYIGPEKEARQFLAPIAGLQPASVTYTYVPWNKLLATAGGAGFNDALCAKGPYRSFYTVNMRELSGSTFQATFDKMTEYYRAHPDALSSYINIETFPNQATAAVPSDATAYAWRDAIGFIQFGIVASDNVSNTTKAAGAEMGRELRDSWVKTSGYPELSIYVNYAHGDEELAQIYGRDKLPRLASLKKTWDPNNIFGYNNALPVTYHN